MLHVEIQVDGRIDEHWSSWFEGLAIGHPAEGETVLTGLVADHSALYGILSRLRDLGLSLTSVDSVQLEEGSAFPGEDDAA
jgi:hypothetical protein